MNFHGDSQAFFEFKDRVRDRFTAPELCELLNLSVDDILDNFPQWYGNDDIISECYIEVEEDD